MSQIQQSVDVDVPVSVAYNQWTQFESFPHFMSGVESITQVDDTRNHWVTSIAGVEREFDTEITEQHPDERIAWRSARCGTLPADASAAWADDLLDGPVVVVRVFDVEEPAPCLVLDLARIEAALTQLALRLLDVRGHRLKALHRTGSSVGQADPEGDRARRTPRCELHETAAPALRRGRGRRETRTGPRRTPWRGRRRRWEERQARDEGRWMLSFRKQNAVPACGRAARTPPHRAGR